MSSDDFKLKIKQFLEVNDQIKTLRKELKERLQEKQKHEDEIKEWMIANEKQQIKSDFGNIVLYNKKVSKGGFSKDHIREKIENELGNSSKAEQLTENLFKKEFELQEALKIVKKNS